MKAETLPQLTNRLANDWSAHLEGRYPGGVLEYVLPQAARDSEIRALIAEQEQRLADNPEWVAADTFTARGNLIRVYRVGVVTSFITP